MRKQILAFALASCSLSPVFAADLDAVIATSFKARGQAAMSRLEQTPQQRACSGPVGMSLPANAAQLQAEAQASVKFPADGQYLGDWQSGEKIAQTGTGMQFSDDPAKPNGGNCYACHQLSVQEIAYGNMGPSLKHYGKLRGTSEPMLKYTWTRLYNTHAYNPCAHMPRFGAAGILSEQQLKDIMALLFDPASPVNQPERP